MRQQTEGIEAHGLPSGMARCTEQSSEDRRRHERGRRSRAVTAGENVPRHLGVEPVQDHTCPAPEKGPGGEPDGDRVVHGRADQVGVVGPEGPEVGLVRERLFCGRGVPDARPYALGPTGGSRGVVHRPSQWERGEVDRWTVVQRDELARIGNDQGRIGVLDESVPL
jgi:hypothetical protein